MSRRDWPPLTDEPVKTSRVDGGRRRRKDTAEKTQLRGQPKTCGRRKSSGQLLMMEYGTSMRLTSIPFITAVTLSVLSAKAELNEKTRASIDQLTGTKGTYTAEEDVHRASFPRSDLKVTIEGRPAHPFMGFG